MKILKPILYCLLGFVLAFLVMYFVNNKKQMQEVIIDKDVPIVELKASPTDISVGDTVTYTVKSRVESDNEAFENNRTFYYDFTGDGMWDLVTKKDSVVYVFEEAYEGGVTPKAAVEFRGKLGNNEGNKIYVKQMTKPILLYNSIGNTVIFRDLSMGIMQQRQICFEDKECKAGNAKYRITHTVPISENLLTGGLETSITKNDTFLFKYDEEGPHNVSIYFKNKYGDEIETGFVIETKDNKENGLIAPGINIITIPEIVMNNGNLEIFLSKKMKNILIMYINNDSGETCFVDTDISKDSDGDGKQDNDRDLECNKIVKIKYEPNYDKAIGRVYFLDNGNLTFKNFYVTFVGYILELNEEQLEIYNDITTLLNGIEDICVENVDLKQSLDKLRKNLNNRTEITTLLITINEQLDEGGIIITTKEKELLDSILSRLSNEYTIISVGMDEYEKNKQEILALLPTKGNIRQTIEGMFKDFEENLFMYNQKERIKELEKIWNVITKDGKKNKWMSDEYESFFTPYFCNIFDYFEINDYADKC